MAQGRTTRSARDDDDVLDGSARWPQLVLAIELGRPTAGARRWALHRFDRVVLAGGAEPGATSAGRTLRVEVPDPWMSKDHAAIELSFGRWMAVDGGSKNGLWINGERVARVELRDGDRIELGRTWFVFRETAGKEPPIDRDASSSMALPLPTLHAPLEQVMAQVSRALDADLPVLVLGESGVGKEVLVRAAHGASRRRGPLIAVNCGAIPANLVESELFGHRRGAFSDAREDRPGHVRSAAGGTLFLDEIGDLPLTAQAALLRVIAQREVVPVGGSLPERVDVRVVAATHRDIPRMAAAGEFRDDLLARLSGCIAMVPPLRERPEDLGLLLGIVLARLATDGRGVPAIAPAAGRALFSYSWPLNVRELEHAIARAVVHAGVGVPLAAHDLPHEIRHHATASPAVVREPLSEADRELRERLVAALGEHRGNVSAVARAFGCDRKQIHRWIRRLEIAVAERRGDAAGNRDDDP